jgi:hypothetical protein
MSQKDHLLRKLPTEMGGLAAGPVERTEHEYLPWEKRCHALANVLDMQKIISTEEKRRGVESLGGEIVGKLAYYERWIVAFANILFQKQILSPEELARKMEEVEARWRREPTKSALLGENGQI